MGRLDKITKDYLEQNHIFADAFNYYLYGGKEVIKETDLHELDTTKIALPYGMDNAVEPIQRSRDVIKGMHTTIVGKSDERATYLILGIESQMNVNYAMPVRNMLYDAINYVSQVKKAQKSYRKASYKKTLTREEFLSGFSKNDRLVPVITLVVFFSANEWDGPSSIYEMLEIDDNDLKKYIADYKINIIKPKELEDADFLKFKTGLGRVLMCAKHINDTEFSVLERPEYENVDISTAILIKEITNIECNVMDYVDEGGSVNMCQALENTKRICREEGRKIIAELMQELLEAGRIEDAKKATIDNEYCEQLLQEFGIVKIN